MVNRADFERRDAWRDIITPPNGIDVKKGSAQSLGKIDENTGAYVCPECGELYSKGCGNCFHSRYKDEDPLATGPNK